MGILKDIKQNNRKRTWKILIVVIIILILLSGYFYNKNKTPIQSYKTAIVQKRDISSTLSADGKVAYKEQYDLNFPTSGTLSKLLKKEGEEVKKGEIIASLDDTYLKINVDKARIAIDTANANLQAKLASKGQITDIEVSQKQLDSSNINLDSNLSQGELDVKNAELNVSNSKNDLDNIITMGKKDQENALNNIELNQANLDNAKTQLDSIKKQETLNVNNAEQKGISEINILIPLIDKYLRDIDVLLGITEANKNINDSYEIYLGAKDANSKLAAENQFRTSLLLFQDFKSKYNNYLSKGEYSESKEWLGNILDISKIIKDNLTSTKEVLKNSITSSSFNQATIDTNIVTFDNDINNIESSIQRIILSIQAIDTANSNLESKKISQQSIIDSYEIQLKGAKDSLEKTITSSKSNTDSYSQKYNQNLIALDTAKTKLENSKKIAQSQINISKANLDLKKIPFDERELEPYYTAIDNAKKGLEEAQKRLEDAILKSPIDGKIGKLTITKIGTNISINPASAFVTIINKNSLYVEAKIEEGDIPNIFVGQEVNFTFNSLENIELKGKVSYISDKAEIDSNSIVTYKTEITFENENPKVKEGFTTQIFFILQRKLNTLSLPFEAVKDENGNSYVTLSDGTKKFLKVGINDGDYIEIISGLKENDIIKY